MKTVKADRQKLLPVKSRKDFLEIQQKGAKWVAKALVLQTAPNDLGVSRIGFTVTKKTSLSAVTRNRIKRRLRAVAADVIGADAKAGHDYILVGRPQTQSAPYEELAKDLRWCLKRLELLENK